MDGLRLSEWLIPESEIEERFSTSGRPGGQHANRNETTVTVRFNVGESSLPEDVQSRIIKNLSEVVEAISSDSRSQWRNRALARQRLVEKLESALRQQKERTPTKTPRRAHARRLEEKKARGQLKKERRTPEDD
jgi:ribosome-associated protein